MHCSHFGPVTATHSEPSQPFRVQGGGLAAPPTMANRSVDSLLCRALTMCQAPRDNPVKKRFYSLLFTEEETEAQGGEGVSPRSGSTW